jgi:hypothetical protein
MREGRWGRSCQCAIACSVGRGDDPAETAPGQRLRGRQSRRCCYPLDDLSHPRHCREGLRHELVAQVQVDSELLAKLSLDLHWRQEPAQDPAIGHLVHHGPRPSAGPLSAPAQHGRLAAQLSGRPTKHLPAKALGRSKKAVHAREPTPIPRGSYRVGRLRPLLLLRRVGVAQRPYQTQSNLPRTGAASSMKTRPPRDRRTRSCKVTRSLRSQYRNGEPARAILCP